MPDKYIEALRKTENLGFSYSLICVLRLKIGEVNEQRRKTDNTEFITYQRFVQWEKEMRLKEAIFYPLVIRFLAQVSYSIVKCLLTFDSVWGRGVSETVLER